MAPMALMAPMANGRILPPKLVLTLTHACNLRCPYCPLVKSAGSMKLEVAQRAAELFFARHPGHGNTVKFFGGEPMLSLRIMRAILPRLRDRYVGKGLKFFVSTNATLLNRSAVRFLQRYPEIETAVSGVLEPRTVLSLPNFHVNIPIPPHLAHKLGEYVARLLARGIRRLNFLPAYYLRWESSQLKALERDFRVSAGLIARRRRRGEAIEVKNETNWAPTPLYNHGMVVGPEGDIYPCNLVFAEHFSHLRSRLRLGNVLESDSIDWSRADDVRYDALIRDALPRDVYRSTYAVDRHLTRFVEALA